MTSRTIAWTTAVAGSIVTGTLLSQAVAQENAPAPAVSIYSAGIDAWLADLRDAGLREALRRIIIDGPSLPPDADPMAAEAIELALSLLLGDTALQLDLVPPAEPGGSPFALELQARGVKGFSGTSMLRQVEDLARASGSPLGTPDADAPGMLRLDRPWEPSIWYGAKDDALLVSVGLPPLDQADHYAEAGLPEGAELLAGLRVDFKSLQPVFAMAAIAQPGLDELFTSWGLLGADPLGVVCAVGATDDGVHMAGHFANYGTHFGHLLPAQGVTESLLRRVPQSACAAEVTRIDFGAYFASLIDTLTEAGGDEAADQLAQGFDQFHAITGVDFRDGLIATLGDSLTVYMSDETGGNGLASIVGLVGLRDARTMGQSLRTLAAAADHVATNEAQGYVRFLPQRISGCDTAVSARFPGLPIPVEPTLAIADDTLIVGLFPQAVAAAVAQFSASTSLLDADPFVAAGGADGVGAVQVKYMDQAVLAAEGFGCMAFLGAAIDNYTRSRRSPEAVAPPVVPSFARLASDMKAGLCVARLDGPDLVASGTADRSLVAQMSAGVGYLGAFSPLLVAAVAGSAMAEKADEFGASTTSNVEQRPLTRLAEPEAAALTDAAPLEARRTRLATLHTAMQLAGSKQQDVRSLRDLVRGGWITTGDLHVPGHADASYLLVGGGALKTADGMPCVIAEPGGLPMDRLCVTDAGSVASVDH